MVDSLDFIKLRNKHNSLIIFFMSYPFIIYLYYDNG